MIIIYFILISVSRNFFLKMLSTNNMTLYLKNKSEYYLNIMGLVFFILYFFVYVRVLRIFFHGSLYINIYSIIESTIFYCHGSFINLVLIILLLLFFLVFLYILNYIIFFFAKNCYLKIHYYFFIRSFVYFNFIKSFEYMDFFFKKNLVFFYFFFF